MNTEQRKAQFLAAAGHVHTVLEQALDYVATKWDVPRAELEVDFDGFLEEIALGIRIERVSHAPEDAPSHTSYWVTIDELFPTPAQERIDALPAKDKKNPEDVLSVFTDFELYDLLIRARGGRPALVHLTAEENPPKVLEPRWVALGKVMEDKQYSDVRYFVNAALRKHQVELKTVDDVLVWP